MTVHDVVFALASVCFLLPSYVEMFEDINIQQFSSTLPPDNREFEVFEVVWYGGCKRVVCLVDNADHLWLYKPRSFKDPIKVDSRLVKKVVCSLED